MGHVLLLSAANPDTLEFSAVKCGPDGILPANATARRYQVMRKGFGQNAYVLAFERGSRGVVEGPYSLLSFQAAEYHPANA